jgi:ferrochelatase
VLPLYPHYAAATTASVADKVMQWAWRPAACPNCASWASTTTSPGYIHALAAKLQAHWQEHGRSEKLVLSFHGVPERACCWATPTTASATRRRAAGRTLGLDKSQMVVTFQSRFGKAKWLEPYTEPTLRELAAQGVKSVDVMCPGFVADCLETLEEIAQEAHEAFLEAGGSASAMCPA